MRRLAVLAAIAMLAGCGDDEELAGAPDHDPGPIHVHGLGVNPTDRALFIATHTGLYRVGRQESVARLVGRSRQDTMGFSVAGPNRFLGSGHPDVRSDLPPHLGLIESTDAGKTWQSVALLGEADFHVLERAGGRVYGFDATNARLLVSSDQGRTWQRRPAPEPLLDLAPHPRRPDTAVAVGSILHRTVDGGRRWVALGGEAGYLAWPAPSRLYRALGSGRVQLSRDGGERWTPLGSIGGEPAALLAVSAAELYAALHDGTIKISRDGGKDLVDTLAAVTTVEQLTRNAVDVLPAGGLEEKLKLGRPLRVKLGIDVTSPDIHVGRGIPLQRMRAFQDAGHIGVLIVGDYTTRIGDPSGRSAERPLLSDEEIDRDARTYVQQASQILDSRRTEVRYNSEWLGTLDFAEILRLTRTTTVAQLLERDDFSNRFAARQPISVSELLYPLMQAYDSVAIEADVELGGTDQLYNLLAGRAVMEAYGLAPQVVLTTPLLLSWDGQKMSSSVGNNIPLTAPAEEQFGRTMRIPDEQLDEWYQLVLERPLPAGEPMEAKLALARAIVARSHGDEAAREAETHFTRVVREGQAPVEVPESALPHGDPVHVPAALAAAFGLSTSEARRLISQGGVKIDGEPLTELDVPRSRLLGATVQAGKRRFVRFVVAP